MTATPTSFRVRPGSALERELAAAKARGQTVADYLHEVAARATGRMAAFLSFEAGYQACERGENPQAALANFRKLLDGTDAD